VAARTLSQRLAVSFRAAAMLALPLSLLLMASPAHASAVGVALWKMNEASGAMIDSVRSHDGSVSNVVRPVPGKKGTAYRFNGVNSKVTVPHASDLNPGSATFTVSAYVKFSKSPQETGQDTFDIIRKGLTGSQYWKMEISLTGKGSCHFTGSSGVATIVNGPVLDNNAWHSITCKKAAGSVKLIVDGVTYTQNVSVGSISNSAVVTLGHKSGGSDFYQGDMDHVSIASG
jgi:Concanavalin A-like lectin/glucanases superfamily